MTKPLTDEERESRDQAARELFGLTDNTVRTDAEARDVLADSDVTRFRQTR